MAIVLDYVRHGWPGRSDVHLCAYASRKDELSVYQGCILWGARVVIPSRAKEAVLTELHEGHPGMTRMKALARMYVWWPSFISSEVA